MFVGQHRLPFGQRWWRCNVHLRLGAPSSQTFFAETEQLPISGRGSAIFDFVAY